MIFPERSFFELVNGARDGRAVQTFLDKLVEIHDSSHVSPNVFTSLLIGAFDSFQLNVQNSF